MPDVLLKDTVDSLAGKDFCSATGDPISNLGELQVPLITREKTLRGMVFQGAPVAKPLASAKKTCQAGHMVIFDEGNSFI